MRLHRMAACIFGRYLASTQPIDMGVRGNTLAAAVGAETAAKLLVRRFLASGSRGLQDLTREWDGLSGGVSHPFESWIKLCNKRVADHSEPEFRICA